MCRRVQCKACGKAGWAGCGAHVDQVLAGVAERDRCTCDRDRAAAASSAPRSTGAGRPSLLARLLRR